MWRAARPDRRNQANTTNRQYTERFINLDRFMCININNWRYSMATVTLSIPDAVKKEMDRLPEIKWSEVFRNMIINKVELFKALQRKGDI
jgi:hypothetical protein